MPRIPFGFSARFFLAAWALVLLGLALTYALAQTTYIRLKKQQADARHLARITPGYNEIDEIPVDPELPEGAQPVRISTGVFVDRIIDLSLRDSYWVVDFVVWFRWNGPADLQPADKIRIVNGSIEERELRESFSRGNLHYERHHIMARITKSFDVSRFPCDNHLLTIALEDPRFLRTERMFLADPDGSLLSTRVQVPGYRIDRIAAIEKPVAYPNVLGDPRFAPEDHPVVSQFRLGIWIHRVNWGLYVKMFQALFVAVAISLLVFFIKPTNVDPRFGLGVGALFASVANFYLTASLVPDTGIITLADHINGLGIILILLTLIQSTISLYIYEQANNPELSRSFDRLSFAVLAPAYLALNILLPLAAIL
jgi:hypothetical protein